MLLIAAPAPAGQWHSGANLVCSDCHTQHNSSGGAPMRTDANPTPARMLLRRGTPMELCLSCHDGANPAAPDVIAPVSYIAESAAGAFPNSGGIATTNAHHLNNPAAEVPPGGMIAMVLTCTTCHDPHGNANYRNLRDDPTRTSLPPQSVIATQKKLPGLAAPEEVYAPSNVIYKSGVSAWCSKCHSDAIGGHDHADDRPMWGAASASYTRWVSTTSPRVPVHSPTDDDVPSIDDRVMCLSCHKAHGSENNAALIHADGLTLDSTCEECHDQ